MGEHNAELSTASAATQGIVDLARSISGVDEQDHSHKRYELPSSEPALVGKSCDETLGLIIDGSVKLPGEVDCAAVHKGTGSGTYGNALDVGVKHTFDPAVVGLLILASSFCLLFAGWIPMELLLTTFKGEMGYYSLMTVYIFVVPGSFFAPWVMARVGDVRCSMLLAAAPYTAFSAALLGMESGICTHGELLYPCAVGVGLGCGVLWGSMGVLAKQFSNAYDITRKVRVLDRALAEDSMVKTVAQPDGSLGLFMGVGTSSAQVGGLLALFGSSVLAQLEISRRALMLTLLLSLSLGNVLLLAMPNACALLRQRQCQLQQHSSVLLLGPQSSGDADGDGERPRVSMLAIPRLLRQSRGLCCLIPCMLSGGYANAFMNGSFTAKIISHSLGEQWVGYVMALRGLAAVMSGVVLGRLSDRIGRYQCFLLSLSCEGVPALYCCIGSFPTAGVGNEDWSRLLIFGLGIFMGVGNAGSQTLLRSIFGDMFDEEVGTALSAGSLFGSSAQFSGYLAGTQLSLQTQAYALFGLWCLNGIGAALASRHQAKA